MSHSRQHKTPLLRRPVPLCATGTLAASSNAPDDGQESERHHLHAEKERWRQRTSPLESSVVRHASRSNFRVRNSKWYESVTTSRLDLMGGPYLSLNSLKRTADATARARVRHAQVRTIVGHNAQTLSNRDERNDGLLTVFSRDWRPSVTRGRVVATLASAGYYAKTSSPATSASILPHTTIFRIVVNVSFCTASCAFYKHRA